jgi:hypothetical protein
MNYYEVLYDDNTTFYFQDEVDLQTFVYLFTQARGFIYATNNVYNTKNYIRISKTYKGIANGRKVIDAAKALIK